MSFDVWTGAPERGPASRHLPTRRALSSCLPPSPWVRKATLWPPGWTPGVDSGTSPRHRMRLWYGMTYVIWHGFGIAVGQGPRAIATCIARASNIAMI